MKNILLGCIFAGLLTVSCKKDERPTYLKDDTSSPSVAVNTTQKPSLIDQAGIQSTNVQTGSTMVTAPGMNPPHGQPNHRCDIPVGQPLNSNPSAQSATAANTQNIAVNGNNTIQIDPNAVSPGKIMLDKNGKQIKTAPGMNPPHGEPNHRCDIPVGQPLNSKPAPQAVANQNISTPQVINPQPVPAQQAVANTGPKPATNPAHGEPWHDCSKQVGAPL